MRVTLNGYGEVITGGVVLAPYRFDSTTNRWTRQTPQELVQDLEQRYPITPTGAPAGPDTVTTGDQAAIIVVYVSGTQGSQAVLSQDGPKGLSTAPCRAMARSAWQGANVLDEDLRRVYQQAAQSAGRLVLSLSKKQVLAGMGVTDARWELLIDQQIKQAKEAGINVKNAPKLDFDRFAASTIQEDRDTVSRANFVATRYAAAGLMLGAMAVGYLVTNFKGGETPGLIMLASMSAILDTADAIVQYRDVSKFIRNLPTADAGCAAVRKILSDDRAQFAQLGGG